MEEHTCYYHPREVVIGICAWCLNERLVVLASRQEQLPGSSSHRIHTSFAYRRNPINLPKIFALSSLLNRLDLRQRKSEGNHCSDSPGSQEDSFISIKFGDNGAASWEERMVPPKLSVEHCNMALKQRLNKELQVDDDDDDDDDQGRVKAVIEHPKPHGSLRWRKRIGHVIQLIRTWKKKPSKGNGSHLGRKKLDGAVKVRHGWIRTLTKKRTKA